MCTFFEIQDKKLILIWRKWIIGIIIFSPSCGVLLRWGQRRFLTIYCRQGRLQTLLGKTLFPRLGLGSETSLLVSARSGLHFQSIVGLRGRPTVPQPRQGWGCGTGAVEEAESALVAAGRGGGGGTRELCCGCRLDRQRGTSPSPGRRVILRYGLVQEQMEHLNSQ